MELCADKSRISPLMWLCDNIQMIGSDDDRLAPVHRCSSSHIHAHSSRFTWRIVFPGLQRTVVELESHW
eukprot:11792-Heterococcus_DN1.PRE.1